MPSDAVTVLGRLLANPVLRRMLRSDPVLAAGALDADPALLEGLDPDALEEQARGLVEKRFHEVGKLLPRTVHGLGPAAAALFERHAASYWPEGHRRHALDALAFARFLESRSEPVCRAELNRLRFGMTRLPFAFRWAPDVCVDGASRRALQILYRRRGAVRSLALYVGF